RSRRTTALSPDRNFRTFDSRDYLFFRSGALLYRIELYVLGNFLAASLALPPETKHSAPDLHPGVATFMNSNIKSAGVANLEAIPGFYRVAIVGAGSLKGKDVAEVLDQRNFPSSEIKLLDDDEATGKLEALKDEMTFIQSIRSEQFDKVDFTFFASEADSTRRNWKQVSKGGSSIVDLSYALENEPNAVVRAPWIERQLGQTITPELAPVTVVAADPIAVILTLLILRVNA